jgi:hypothetical protein
MQWYSGSRAAAKFIINISVQVVFLVGAGGSSLIEL